MENVPNEILRTPDWLVDHRGGRLRRLHARFGGALCGVPMRRDAYAGMCWLIDGAEVPLSAVRRSGRPVYTGRFSANGLALALSLSYAADKAGRLTVSAERGGHRHAALPGEPAAGLRYISGTVSRLQRSAFPHTAPL